jgi:hypothetical protein
MSGSDELHLEGCDLPQDLVYDLNSGANLISYPDPGSTELSLAIPDDVEGLFAAVLSEGGAAMNTGNGWIGSLTNFSGGAGYWVIVDEDLSFSYNIGVIGRKHAEYIEVLPDDYAYSVTQSSEQAFYFIENVELLEGAIENGDWLLSYNDNILTGIRQWNGAVIDVPAMGYNDLDVNTMGYFIEGDMPTFKLLKNVTGELIELGGDIESWSSNGYSIVNQLVEIENIPVEFGLDDAYPNPFNPITTLSYKLPLDSKVSVKIYNVQGRLIETLVNQDMQAGYHSLTWNADNHSSGMYFVKLIVGEQVSTQKLLLVK